MRRVLRAFLLSVVVLLVAVVPAVATEGADSTDDSHATEAEDHAEDADEAGDHDDEGDHDEGTGDDHADDEGTDWTGLGLAAGAGLVFAVLAMALIDTNGRKGLAAHHDEDH